MPPKGKYVAGKQVSRWDAESDNVDIEYKNLENSATPPCELFSGKKGKALKALGLLVLFLVGLILGYIVRRNIHEKLVAPSRGQCKQQNGIGQDYDERIRKLIQNDLQDRTNLDDHISQWSSSRLSATGTTLKLVGYAWNMWCNDPIDEIWWSNYTVTLSYAKFWEPHLTFILRESSNSSVIYQTQYFNMSNTEPFEMPFNAYSPSKSVKGKLVYANYGSMEDFETLNKTNIPVQDSIVLIKYGKIHPANKVKHAEDSGALGVILYPDPLDFANNGTDVYPDTWWMPNWAVPTHHVRYNLLGDPQTPGYAAVSAFSVPSSKVPCLGCPKIPVQSISYKDAREYIRGMDGPSVPDDWIGGLGVPYRTGPGHIDDSLINLTVTNVLERRKISNLIAVIKGKYEPDRYVLIGAHYDSWTKGAVDGSSEFAVMSELIRSFSYSMQTTGWRPRRTIMFALWDASKYGHIGSFEWVQEYETLLDRRAVAYINLDTVVRGNYSFCAESSPMLFDMVQLAADTVQCSDPDYPEMSVLDMWRIKFPDPKNSTLPNSLSLQGDSDHSPFVYYLGIPSISPAFTYNTKKYKNLPNYPAYNTLEDTKEYLTNFTDKNYTLHVKVSQILADMILRLTDSAIIPLNVKSLTTLVNEGRVYVEQKESVFAAASMENYTSFLLSEIDLFETAAVAFHRFYHDKLKSNPSETTISRYNDVVMTIPRLFISHPGLPGYKQYRNLLEAPHPENLYQTQVFPGIAWTTEAAIQTQDWTEVKRQFSLLTLALRQAAALLNDGHGKGLKTEL